MIAIINARTGAHIFGFPFRIYGIYICIIKLSIMTWNDLIARLQQIPENRREEQAVYFLSDSQEGFIIDEMEEVNSMNGLFDSTVGDDNGNTFILIS